MKYFTIILAILTIFLTEIPSFAKETGESCIEIKMDSSRLKCYDSIYRPSSITASQTQLTGKWQVRSEISPIDDSTKVFVSLTGNDGIVNRFGQKENMSIYIACRENTTSLYIYFGGNFMSDNQGAGRITYRVDNNTAKKKSFTESNNNEALGLWNGGSSIPFIKSLFGGNRLYVQATPYNENAISDFFSITGLEEAIKPLREACNW